NTHGEFESLARLKLQPQAAAQKSAAAGAHPGQEAVSKAVTPEIAEKSSDFAKVESIPARRTQVNPRDGLIYAWIPAGTFFMGCSAGDTGCSSNEEPRRQVAITKGFWMGQTEVTTEAFQRVAGKRATDAPGGRMPIVGASWD